MKRTLMSILAAAMLVGGLILAATGLASTAAMAATGCVSTHADAEQSVTAASVVIKVTAGVPTPDQETWSVTATAGYQLQLVTVQTSSGTGETSGVTSHDAKGATHHGAFVLSIDVVSCFVQATTTTGPTTTVKVVPPPPTVAPPATTTPTTAPKVTTTTAPRHVGTTVTPGSLALTGVSMFTLILVASGMLLIFAGLVLVVAVRRDRTVAWLNRRS